MNMELLFLENVEKIMEKNSSLTSINNVLTRLVLLFSINLATGFSTAAVLTGRTRIIANLIS